MNLKIKLSDRWRPKSFREVVGQRSVVRWCLDRLRDNDPQHVLFCGPSGCGKNSLARLYGRALGCIAPDDDGLACNSCSACSTPLHDRHSSFYKEVSCPQLNKTEIRALLDELRRAPWTGKRRVVVFDEVQSLTRQQQWLLLDVLQQSKLTAVVMLLTTDPDALLPALRERPARQDIVSPTVAELIEFGAKVCDAENIEFETGALALLADDAECRIRGFLQRIDDEVTRSNAVLEANVRGFLYANFDAAAAVIRSLLKVALGRALHATKTGYVNPAQLSEQIQELLTEVALKTRLNDLYGPSSSVPERYVEELASVEVDTDLLARINRLDLFSQMRSFWVKGVIRKDGDLRGTILDCCSWLENLRDGDRHQSPGQMRRGRAPKALGSRPHRHGPQDRSVSFGLARRVWDAASLMSQVHGVYFNARLAFRPDQLGFVDDGRAQEFFGYLIRNLVDRVREWCGADGAVHWAYTKTGFGLEVVYTAALVLPESARLSIETWIEDFTAKQFGKIAATAVTLRFATAAAKKSPGRYQRALLKILCRGVDPMISLDDGNGRRPLVDAIGVPRAIRFSGPNHMLSGARVSKTIGESTANSWVDRGLPVLTPARDGAWSYEHVGWEIAEHRERQAELARQERLNGAGVRQDSLLVVGAPSSHSSLTNLVVPAQKRRRKWTTTDMPGWWWPPGPSKLPR